MKIINAGLLTTIQDMGRNNFQKFGIPISGVMDEYSYRISNILLDNNNNEAVLEITMIGPIIKFTKNAIIAITGGDLSPKINNQNIKMWSSIFIKKGDVLSFSKCISGCRSYISVKGGIDVKKTMGSRSTYTKSLMGGIDGKPLKNNQIIPIKNINMLDYTLKKLPIKYIPNYNENKKIRVILGPQDDYFTDKGIRNFLNSKYIITNDSDRMGYRLEGKEIELKSNSDIISDGIAFGSIQVPGNNKPIVLMADRQTTGGYAKIATIISSDLFVFSQKKPGDTVEFENIDIYEAHEILKDYENKFIEIKDYFYKVIEIKEEKNYVITINHKKYKVNVKEY